MGGIFARVCFAAAASGAALMLAGCAILDYSVSPRTYSVNESADSVLNNAVLLNIIRAANSEPLSFIAIAKYTAGGQLTASAAAGPNNYAAQVSRTLGPVTLSGQASNSFDLNVLETKDFYQGLLQNLDPIAIELWFRQGLPRALVFYMLLDSIRTSTSDGVYEYRNDPTDDNWTDDVTGVVEPRSPRCIPIPTGRGHQTNYGIDATIWHGIHGEDCRFHKFQHLVLIAVKFGLHLETITIPNAKGGQSDATPSGTGQTAIPTPNAVQATTPNATPKAAPGAAAPTTPAGDATTKMKTQICYDAATLRAVAPARDRPLFSTCGRNKPSAERTIRLGGIGTMTDTQLVVRSAFGIFQYLGRLFATGSPESMTLGPREFDVNTRDDDRLLTVVEGVGPDCFASAEFRSSFYCVPNSASNTKLIFTMLRAMLATNISAALLNTTPTVLVTP
jgi:hypothetical protein